MALELKTILIQVIWSNTIQNISFKLAYVLCNSMFYIFTSLHSEVKTGQTINLVVKVFGFFFPTEKSSTVHS